MAKYKWKYFFCKIKDFRKYKKSIFEANKIININLNPIYEYKSDNNEISKLEKMIYLKENQFIWFSEKNVFLFKCIINENDMSIELKKNYPCNNMINFYVLQKDEKEIIVMNSRNNLYFYYIPNFEWINQFFLNQWKNIF